MDVIKDEATFFITSKVDGKPFFLMKSLTLSQIVSALIWCKYSFHVQVSVPTPKEISLSSP